MQPLSSTSLAGWERALAALAFGLMMAGCGRFGYDFFEPNAGGEALGHCGNGVLDEDEAGIDCGGGACDDCGVGDACSTDTDCAGASCLDGACRAASCADGVQNHDETDLDCGSSCAPCADESGCSAAADCLSGRCVDGMCLAATCADVIQNQDETGVDCGGGSCAPCPTCGDALQNQDETGVDCGGARCDPCPDTSGCLEPGDCGSAHCVDNACVAASCDDDIQNQDERGVDCGGSTCAACPNNTPPLVRFSVSPGVGSHDGTPATIFQGDASGTTDLEDAASALDYAWDWDDDGVTDATGLTVSHVYAVEGAFTVRLSVQDTGGMRASDTFVVIVSSESNIVRVTTAADENDGGATPAIPGGAGLSLREAIAYANATAGRQSILVPSGFTIALTDQLPDPADALGMDIVGDGVTVDGSGTGQADDCIGFASPNNRLFGLEIQNCKRSPLRLAFGAAGSHFSRLNIHDNAQEVVLFDSNVRFGPSNEVARSDGYCVSVIGAAAIIDWNFIHDCATRGIDLTGNSDGALVLGNVISGSNPGVLFGVGASNVVVAHNVLHANVGDGISISTVDNDVVLRNNIFSNNSGFGLRAGDNTTSFNDHNDYFGNVLGTCNACSSLGAGSLTLDPLYIDSSANDFRLQPASPAIDTGVDTGNDVNGLDPGNGLFNGAQPDIGARESP